MKNFLKKIFYNYRTTILLNRKPNTTRPLITPIGQKKYDKNIIDINWKLGR